MSSRTAVLLVLLLTCIAILLCVTVPVAAHAATTSNYISYGDDFDEMDDLTSEMLAGRGLGEFAEYFPEGSFYDDALHPPGASASFPPGTGPATYSSALELLRDDDGDGGNHHMPAAILAALSGEGRGSTVDDGGSNALVLLSSQGDSAPLELVPMSDLKGRPARQLRNFIANRDASCDGCVEKYHLVERAAELRLMPTVYDKALQQLTPLQTAISTTGAELAHLGATTPQQDAARMKEMETAEVLADPSMHCIHDNTTNILHCNRRAQ